MVRGGKIVLVLLMAGLVLSSCRGGDAPGGDQVRHPGEADPARSTHAREEVKACAEDAGWELHDLELLVDKEGLLIRMAYRSRNIVPGTPEDQAVETCLTQADVTQPSPVG